MLTEQQIKHRAHEHAPENMPTQQAIRQGYIQGATWANAKNAKEIAELVEALRELKSAMEQIHFYGKEVAETTFTFLSDEEKAFENAQKLLKKYEPVDSD